MWYEIGPVNTLDSHMALTMCLRFVMHIQAGKASGQSHHNHSLALQLAMGYGRWPQPCADDFQVSTNTVRLGLSCWHLIRWPGQMTRPRDLPLTEFPGMWVISDSECGVYYFKVSPRRYKWFPSFWKSLESVGIDYCFFFFLLALTKLITWCTLQWSSLYHSLIWGVLKWIIYLNNLGFIFAKTCRKYIAKSARYYNARSILKRWVNLKTGNENYGH